MHTRNNEALAHRLDTGEDVKLIGRGVSGSVVKEIDAEKHTAIYRITDATVDSYGDVVEPSGMVNTRFRSNPVVFFAHRSYDFPVGRSLWERIESDEVRAETEYAVGLNPIADTTWAMVNAGFMPGVSIGFAPKSYEKIMRDSDTGPEWTGGFRFKEWELLEYSPVGIPANPNALQVAAKGLLGMAAAMGMATDQPDDELSQILAGAALVKRYPELMHPGGLDAAVRKTFAGLGIDADELSRAVSATRIDARREAHEAADLEEAGELIREFVLQLQRA
jgi:phage head maturation protease